MSPTILPTARRASGVQGAHVLYALLAFFGLVFAANGVLIYLALSTHSGLVAEEPYRKGLAYNARIAAGERQAMLGWTDTLTVDPTGRVELAIADARGVPVAGLAAGGVIGRPSTGRHDRVLAFEELRPGRYVAAVGTVPPGGWRVEIEMHDPAPGRRSGSDPLYRLRREVWLAP